MEDYNLREAQLYRVLVGVFGKERVIPRAKITLVCGGVLPDLPEARYPKYASWAEGFRCLFTIVNGQDEPCLVIEFFSGFGGVIDPVEAEREHYLPSVLRCRNIYYMTLSEEEFDELIAPEASMSFLELMEFKIGDEVLS